MLEAWATEPLPALPPAATGELSDRLLMLAAALPRRSSDSLAGSLMVAAYERKLGHLPLAALDFLVDRALETCRWFPTIAECLEIVAAWSRADEAVQVRREAERLAARERTARFDEAETALREGTMTQAGVDALPERWRWMLEAKGLLHRCTECGCFWPRKADAEGDEVVDPELSAVLGRIAARFPSERASEGGAR